MVARPPRGGEAGDGTFRCETNGWLGNWPATPLHPDATARLGLSSAVHMMHEFRPAADNPVVETDVMIKMMDGDCGAALFHPFERVTADLKARAIR
jgi:hypothetical protein